MTIRDKIGSPQRPMGMELVVTIDDATPNESDQVDAGLAAAFARIARGEGAGLDAVWTEIADDLLGLALWRTGSYEDAEDAVQETFLRLARAGSRLARVRRPRAWLLAVCHRAAVDLVRRRKPAVVIEDVEALFVAADDPERTAEAVLASHALASLPADQRAAVYLREVLGLSFSEIGRTCGIATFTAASRCRLGIAKLRRALGVGP